MSKQDKYIELFLLENHENLERLDQDLVALEKNPNSAERIANIFRALHTFKGGCGFLGFSNMEALAHTGESLLATIRDGKLKLSQEIISALLEMVDALRYHMVEVETKAKEGVKAYSKLQTIINAFMGITASPRKTVKLRRIMKGSKAATKKTAPVKASEPVEAEPENLETGGEVNPVHEEDSEATEEVHVSQGATALVEHKEEVEESDPDPDPEPEVSGDASLSAISTIRVEDDSESVRPPVDSKATLDVPQKISSANQTIRVDIQLLDFLANQVGEMVLTRNRLMQLAKSLDSEALAEVAQSTDLITSTLQETVMKTRLQPLRVVGDRLPRIVRDLALACGKQVNIEMDGLDTELDKSLLEAISEPLIHIVRNSVDHGLENPKERRHRGKSEVGEISLRASYEGGLVSIAIKDDGAGIDPQRLKESAIRQGQITAEQGAKMNSRELVNLIFQPGFSTAQKVTRISGRGVGMDVVRNSVKSVGGNIQLQSKLGEGTEIKIKVPLTLAILSVLIVECAGQSYLIPHSYLRELIKLKGDQRDRILSIHGALVYRHRNDVLPLVRLSEELNLNVEPLNLEDPDQSVSIVILHAEDKDFGLIVDTVIKTEEIVVKPLGKRLQLIQHYSGATILGDGTVALILDVMGLARNAHVFSNVQDLKDEKARKGEQDVKADVVERERLIILEGPDDSRLAIPAKKIHRLEALPKSSIENVGGRLAVQYRNQILPLCKIFDLLPERRTTPRNPDWEDPVPNQEKFHVIICQAGDRDVGLISTRILDVVDASLEIRRPASREGVLYSVVINDRITELLNIAWLVGKGFEDGC